MQGNRFIDILVKKCLIISILFSGRFLEIYCQPANYYSSAEGKTGIELKSALHNIIRAHVDFSYRDAKYILNYADSDPENQDNLILFYTKRSQLNTTWGTGSNDINREHIWAKSHGRFANIRPMDGDAYNLHPADASVNIIRSNRNFDECSESGAFIPEANAFYTSTQFEPQDAAKGEVARTLFYMAVRYEGTDNEFDLEMVDNLDSYPNPEFGKLSTLLKWNNEFPPTDMERRRNERVYDVQRNRNPFIDYPEFADRIWANKPASLIKIQNLSMYPQYPGTHENAYISAHISSSDGIVRSAILYYGTSFNSEENFTIMTNTGEIWSGSIDLSGFTENDFIYYMIVASDSMNTASASGNYRIPAEKKITTIEAIQGTVKSSPCAGSIVTISGIVTANLDNTFYLQSTGTRYSGICVFDIRRGKIGDSISLTGRVSEYKTLTEIDQVSYVYNHGHKRFIEPKIITINEVNECFEGMLVTFKNVSFPDWIKIIPLTANTKITFTDGVNSMIIYSRYNSRISGKALPYGSADVTGVISQYADTYQLLVNDISDIKSGIDNEAPIITGVAAKDKEWIELSFNEKINLNTAETIGNYSFTGGLIISCAYLLGNTKVLLRVKGLQQIDYNLTVSGIKDMQGNETSNTCYTFYSEYSNQNLKNISCLDDTLTLEKNDVYLIGVLKNDTLPDNFALKILKEPVNGKASVEFNNFIHYELFSSDNLLAKTDTIVYQVCDAADPDYCSQASVYIALDFTISINESATEPIRIWPNPVHDILHFNSAKMVTTLEIFDLTGKSLYKLNPSQSVFQVQMPVFQGMYFMRIGLDGGETVLKKILKQ